MDKGVIYMPPDNCSWGKLPPGYWFQTITPKIIALWQYPPENSPEENCLSDDLSPA